MTLHIKFISFNKNTSSGIQSCLGILGMIVSFPKRGYFLVFASSSPQYQIPGSDNICYTTNKEIKVLNVTRTTKNLFNYVRKVHVFTLLEYFVFDDSRVKNLNFHFYCATLVHSLSSQLAATTVILPHLWVWFLQNKSVITTKRSTKSIK